MKRDRVLLCHVRDALDNISQYTVDGRELFLANRMTQDAVIRNLEIIGEAVKHLSTGLTDGNPDILWKQIAGMRDVLIHHYFGVKLATVWMVVERDLPSLREKVAELLTEDDPGAGMA